MLFVKKKTHNGTARVVLLRSNWKLVCVDVPSHMPHMRGGSSRPETRQGCPLPHNSCSVRPVLTPVQLQGCSEQLTFNPLEFLICAPGCFITSKSHNTASHHPGQHMARMKSICFQDHKRGCFITDNTSHNHSDGRLSRAQSFFSCTESCLSPYLRTVSSLR